MSVLCLQLVCYCRFKFVTRKALQLDFMIKSSCIVLTPGNHITDFVIMYNCLYVLRTAMLCEYFFEERFVKILTFMSSVDLHVYMMPI